MDPQQHAIIAEGFPLFGLATEYVNGSSQVVFSESWCRLMVIMPPTIDRKPCSRKALSPLGRYPRLLHRDGPIHSYLPQPVSFTRLASWRSGGGFQAVSCSL